MSKFNVLDLFSRLGIIINFDIWLCRWRFIKVYCKAKHLLDTFHVIFWHPYWFQIFSGMKMIQHLINSTFFSSLAKYTKNQIHFWYNWEGILFYEFLHCFYIFMPGGRARGNPVQIFFENYQNFPSIDWKPISLFDIAIRLPYTWHMNFGPAPLSWDFSILGAQWAVQYS